MKPLSLFPTTKPVIAMIHVGALPGTPAQRLDMETLIANARSEAAICRDAGVHGLMVENMHDTPYLRGGVGPEIVAAMTLIAREVKEAGKLPCGVQILAGANMEALAVAHAAGLDFIRAEGFAFAHIADEGWIESSAAELLRFRRRIIADRVQVWADVRKKHASHAITADVGIEAMAEAVEFMRGDAVIVTGTTTGRPPRPADVRAAARGCNVPVYVGSGVTAKNLGQFYSVAGGFIIGSELKRDGQWLQPIDPRRVEKLMSAHAKLSSSR